MAVVAPFEKVLPYSRSAVGAYDGVQQRFSFDCGPASAQIILAAQGIYRTEEWLIDKIGTTINGTNSAECITPTLNELLPGSGYTSVWLSREPVPDKQVDKLWADLTRSINAQRGVILNFEVPPGQPIRTSRGSVAPPYPRNQTTYHYTAGMGAALDADGSRHGWVADPAAFGGITGYWCRIEEIARLIVPHAYAYAATAPIVVDKPTPGPTPTPAPVDLSDKLTRLWTEWNAVEFGDQDAIATIARAAQSGDARATYALGKLEQINPAALQAFITRKA